MQGVPGTNRRTQPNSSGQCFFVSVGNALIELLSEVTFNDNSWHVGRIGRRRLLVSKLQRLLARHVREVLTKEEFHRVFLRQNKTAYANKAAYADRLEEAGDRAGRQDWGGLEDLQIVAHWLEASSDFCGSLYTFVRGHDTLTRVTKAKLYVRQPPGNVRDTDIVLHNSGNTHWMNTVVTNQQFPPVAIDQGHGGMLDEEAEVINVD
jgi:hypothetical protein